MLSMSLQIYYSCTATACFKGSQLQLLDEAVAFKVSGQTSTQSASAAAAEIARNWIVGVLYILSSTLIFFFIFSSIFFI